MDDNIFVHLCNEKSRFTDLVEGSVCQDMRELLWV